MTKADTARVLIICGYIDTDGPNEKHCDKPAVVMCFHTGIYLCQDHREYEGCLCPKPNGLRVKLA